MKILILTTKTFHHDYFINSLNISNDRIFVIYEGKKNKPKFKTNHIFTTLRNKYEKKYFGDLLPVKKKIKKFKINDINSKNALKCVKQINPDLVIDYGTSILKSELLDVLKNKKVINLHGGDPETYRGLDSYLWCLYHKDFTKIVACVHKINNGIDTGDILRKKKIIITKKTSIYSIRAQVTEKCVEMVNELLVQLLRSKKIKSFRQIKKGRYYSFFPAVLINTCIKNFNNYKKNYVTQK